jgi:O-acetylhomoserine (thiol)-lyase
MEKGFTTKLLHTSFAKNDSYGALQIPIYANSAFEFESSEDIEGAFKGTKPAHAYSRSGNPTVEFLELRIKTITNSRAVLACASGMAAISNTILALCNPGDTIISTKFLFGNTLSFFEDTLKQLGICVKYVNFDNLQNVESAIDSNTKLIFFETISNPLVQVIDVKALAEISKKIGTVLVADTSMTPPNAFDTKSFGVDINIMSSTKYISCGASTVGGIIVDNGNHNWHSVTKLKSFIDKYGDLAFISKLRKEIFRNTGGCLSPFNAYLQAVGLETLVLRYDRSSQNANELAHWLEKHPKIKHVNYPGLESSAYFNVAKKQFGKNPGGLLSFELSSKDECFQFMDNLKIIKRATNLSDNKSLIIHPKSTIYCEYSEQFIQECAINDSMVRLSVGIEDIEDLIEDISSALN